MKSSGNVALKYASASAYELPVDEAQLLHRMEKMNKSRVWKHAKKKWEEEINVVGKGSKREHWK